MFYKIKQRNRKLDEKEAKMGSNESVQTGYPYKNLCEKASSW